MAILNKTDLLLDFNDWLKFKPKKRVKLKYILTSFFFFVFVFQIQQCLKSFNSLNFLKFHCSRSALIFVTFNFDCPIFSFLIFSTIFPIQDLLALFEAQHNSATSVPTHMEIIDDFRLLFPPEFWEMVKNLNRTSKN